MHILTDAPAAFGIILRIATQTERYLLDLKNEEESVAHNACVHFTNKVLRLNVLITGVSFQFDGTKLIVFYRSDDQLGRIDFRPLVNELFGMYRVTVRMHRVSDVM